MFYYWYFIKEKSFSFHKPSCGPNNVNFLKIYLFTASRRFGSGLNFLRQGLCCPGWPQAYGYPLTWPPQCWDDRYPHHAQ